MIREFTTPGWVHSTNIYEVNIRQYTPEGTFTAFARHLPRLREMGIQTLWFMPLTPISEVKRKGTLGSYYACSDYTAVNPEYGTLEDLRELLNKARAMGFKILLDWVANHTGWDHVWTQKYPEYFLRDTTTGGFKTAKGMDDIIELDFSNTSLRYEMIESMKWWVREFDLDGFRCDLAFWVVLDFWKQARLELNAVKPLFWLGEFDELEHPEYGEAFDASYSWTWMHKTRDFYEKKISINDLVSVLKKYDDLGDATMRCWFTSNHDENSWNGTEFEKYGEMAKVLAVFCCTWNGIPLIYSGQEIPNKKRLEFFEKDTLQWERGCERQDFYKKLMLFREHCLALRSGDPAVQTFRIRTNRNEPVFSFIRKNGMSEVFVILNFSDRHFHEWEILDSQPKGTFRNIFSGEQVDFSLPANLELRSWDFLVLEKMV